MIKAVNFSRVFPAYHPKKGKETHFVEAILTQLGIDYTSNDYFIWLCNNNKKISEPFLNDFFNSLSQDIYPKSHTIRSHVKPLNVGDFVNPTCWAGSPYRKTPEGYWKIKFAPDIEVKKTWDIQILNAPTFFETKIDGKEFNNWSLLSKNDGLTAVEMLDWFKINNIVNGRIICWNENIKY